MTYFGTSPGTNGFAAIISPSNQFLTNFSARWFIGTNIADTVGRSLEFDLANNAIWQKGPGKALFKTSFDPAVGLGGTRISATNVLVAANFPPGLMGLGLDMARNLAAGVVSNSNASADSLNLYDISELNSPVLLVSYDFPTNPQVANANRISQTFFKNDLLFSLDANNGIMVFRITQPGPPTVMLTHFVKLANGLFQLGYASSDSRSWTVFASTNLSDWNSIGAATQTSPGWFQFTDPAAANSAQRFYQLRAQ
jgi:hypothetical protein